ncbi:hypothetical protein U1Q18_016693 [Sarracenia purpurea var. burkii]
MPVTGVSDPNENYKKSFHGRRKDSVELNVFEATKYFSSAATDEALRNKGKTFDQRIARGERQKNPIMEKKNKQPSSPGGRLAGFLNFLFNQTSSKKKKSMSTTTQSTMKDEDEDESPGGGSRMRKRRSGVCHFLSASTTDSKSINSSSSSGFRMPPPYSYTPIKIHKDPRSYSGHKPVESWSKAYYDDKRRDCAWFDEKLMFPHKFTERLKNSGDESSRLLEKDRVWGDKYLSSEEKKFMKAKEDQDDGAESDSSSDLFELENYDLGYCYSSGLPVYKTTHIENIKRTNC